MPQRFLMPSQGSVKNALITGNCTHHLRKHFNYLIDREIEMPLRKAGLHQGKLESTVDSDIVDGSIGISQA